MSLGLYLHYPFCSNRCGYCDFYKEVRDPELERRYFQALTAETALTALRYGLKGRQLHSIFIGGGTPSLADLELLESWLDQVRHVFDVPGNVEFSIETNPESVSLEKLKTWQRLGVNRPVFGVQSFNSKLLRRLGRRHHPEDSQRAIYQTRALGYPNFGVDLIFGLPGQTTKMLSADLDQLLGLEPPHISFYQLTVEPGTQLAKHVAEGKLHLPDSETSLAMYRGGCERMVQAGYTRYEVSSLARPGFECRHNLGYWLGDDYLGLGPSSHSFIGGKRSSNPRDIGRWLGELEERRLPARVDETGDEERMTEAIMLGLRMAQGVNRRRFAARFGRPVDERLDPQQYRLFIRTAHLIEEDDYLRLSPDGLCLADEITRRLLK
jgi:oxygen-independent coproporphyrinogen-3 oxidase